MRPIISLMLAVPDAPKAAAWYKEALGATELWNLGSVIGLEIAGAPFFVGEPANNGWESPIRLRPPCRMSDDCVADIPNSPGLHEEERQ
jgi:PhnB protein